MRAGQGSHFVILVYYMDNLEFTVSSLFVSLPGLDPWVGKIPWKGERVPTPVFCPGEFHELYSPWGRKELDMTQ